MILTVGSTYAGTIDAFGYAVNKINEGEKKLKLLWQIEKERNAHKYLTKNHPDVRRYYFDEYHEQYGLEHVDILCGGDPCQPSSVAGDRQGESDYRFRWPFMFSLIKANRPNWVINENVTGSISNMVLDQKITDLEKIGYTCQSFIIPAIACNADHQRNRVFLIANANVQRRRELLCIDPGASFEKSSQTTTLGTQSNPFLRFQESVGEPALFPVADGIPDHIFRLGAAGNSIYATIPVILLEAIWAIENSLK